ncbi:MAG: polysaccharide biosynthesis tyrosine autokinase [Gemmatimonadota bacterium]|nr:polysaccharide biosynthesis tyrosine autokinase [Gemmatimonadota bacterium]
MSSGHLTPYNGLNDASPGLIGPGGGMDPPDPVSPATSAKIPWTRYLAVAKRFRIPIALIVLVGTGLGVLATRFLPKSYEAGGTLWISTTQPFDQQRSGPIRPQELLSSNNWVELFRSFAVADHVVSRLTLNVTPAIAADEEVFSGFVADSILRPGHYTMSVDSARRSYTLMRQGTPAPVERGVLGDSIGRRLGFHWAPAPALFARRSSVEFSVTTPRQAAGDLMSRISMNLPENSVFLRVTLKGDQPTPTARALNAYMEEFVKTAAELKRRNLAEFARILDAQLKESARTLREGESSLEHFRMKTITQPTENAPVASGLAQTKDPVFSNFFAERVDLENVRRDREALERILGETQGVGLSSALLSLPGVVEGDPQLKSTLTELYTQQAKLQAMRNSFTEEYKPLKDEAQVVRTMETQTIPALARAAVERLRRRESELDRRVTGASAELRNVPARTIEENRLRREVAVGENLYTTLQGRYETAKLAAASAIPDVSVLDRAVGAVPPSRSKAPFLVFAGFAASVALAGAFALVADGLDRRFRYPEQAEHDLGLEILGAVPRLRRADEAQDPEIAAQVVEAFRTIRLQMVNDLPRQAGAIALTITSPGEGDGKTTVSSNLGLSFAEAGYRTVLIDGDTRRGQLHAIFNLDRRPGLIDYLMGAVTLDETLRPSSDERLMIITSGIRRHRGPEMLASAEMAKLIAELRKRFDVIIVDSPPLAAGIDAYALGVTTGSMLLVLRAGVTDRRVAKAKLNLLDKLPTRVLGAVLNDIDDSGPYRQYGYIGSYYTAEDEEIVRSRLPSGAI